MSQEAISATSRYWDGKKIVLTENTKKNILKKAYTLDAETMLAQYQLEGNDAAKALENNGVTQESLMANPNTYSFLGVSAIAELEQNASKESRVNAVQNLTALGYTNIFDDATKNFITPPEEQVEEKPKEPQPEPEPESRYQYLRRSRPQEPPPQEYYQEPQPEIVAPSPRAQLAGAARFIPNAVRQALPQTGPRNMSPARMSPAPGAYVRPPVRGMQPQTQAKKYAPQQPRSLLNSEAARRLGAAKPGGVQRLAPKASFGLRGRR